MMSIGSLYIFMELFEVEHGYDRGILEEAYSLAVVAVVVAVCGSMCVMVCRSPTGQLACMFSCCILPVLRWGGGHGVHGDNARCCPAVMISHACTAISCQNEYKQQWCAEFLVSPPSPFFSFHSAKHPEIHPSRFSTFRPRSRKRGSDRTADVMHVT